jgi:hypothetical protein
MSSNIKEVREELERLKQAIKETNQVQREHIRLTNAIMSLSTSLGLGRDYNRAMNKLRSWLAMMQAVYAMMKTLETARMAAGDPIAWATFIVSGLSVGVNVSQELGSYG